MTKNMSFKQLRVAVLERVIKHTIRGDRERADALTSKLMEAVGAQIVHESNWGNQDDPMFAARRELQRELEDDIEADRVEDAPAVDDGSDLDGDDVVPVDGVEDDCCATEVADLIGQLIGSGDLSQEQLEQIVQIAIGAVDTDVDADAGLDVDPAATTELPADGDIDPAIDQTDGNPTPPADLDPPISIR